MTLDKRLIYILNSRLTVNSAGGVVGSVGSTLMIIYNIQADWIEREVVTSISMKNYIFIRINGTFGQLLSSTLQIGDQEDTTLF